MTSIKEIIASRLRASVCCYTIDTALAPERLVPQPGEPGTTRRIRRSDVYGQSLKNCGPVCPADSVGHTITGPASDPRRGLRESRRTAIGRVTVRPN